MTLLRGQVKKQLYLREGVLVSADSNLREEALGAVLVALGLLPASRLNELLVEVKRRGQKMGRVLTDLGWVSPDDVLVALAEQVRGRAVSCLRWTDSETTFESTTAFVGGLIEHRFAVGPLVFAGLRDTCTLDLLAATLDQESGRTVRLAPRFEHVPGRLHGGLRPPGGRGAGQRASRSGRLVMRPDASVLAYGLDALIVTNLTETGRRAGPGATLFGSESTTRDLAPAGLDALAELVRSPTTAAARGRPSARPGRDRRRRARAARRSEARVPGGARSFARGGAGRAPGASPGARSRGLRVQARAHRRAGHRGPAPQDARGDAGGLRPGPGHPGGRSRRRAARSLERPPRPRRAP